MGCRSQKGYEIGRSLFRHRPSVSANPHSMPYARRRLRRTRNEVIDQRWTMSVSEDRGIQPSSAPAAATMHSWADAFSTVCRYIQRSLQACSDKLPSDPLHWRCAEYRYRRHMTGIISPSVLFKYSVTLPGFQTVFLPRLFFSVSTSRLQKVKDDQDDLYGDGSTTF